MPALVLCWFTRAIDTQKRGWLIAFAASLALTGFTIQPAAAQGLNGYVITLQGDTLRGLLQEYSTDQLKLYLAGTHQPQLFSPATARGYGLQGQPALRSLPVRMADGNVAQHFLAARLQGSRASIYTFADETELLLQPSMADTVYQLTAINWHLLFTRHLGGCPAIDQTSAELLQLRFTEYNVLSLVRSYNQCLDPQWKPNFAATRSIWRTGVGLRAAYSRIFSNYSDNNLGKVPLQQVQLEWTGLRANGLQVHVGLGYGVRQQTTPYYSFPIYSSSGVQQVELQDRYRTNMALFDIGLSRRWGLPRRINFLAGLSAGTLYGINTTWETRQRNAAGTVGTLKIIRYRGNETSMYFGVSAGAVIPLGTWQDLELTARYQRFLGLETSSAGVQLAYPLLRRKG